MPIQILGGIRPTTRNRAVGDILAGVTLASMNVPQVLGYIRMACPCPFRQWSGRAQGRAQARYLLA
jgi:hypothetical protein